MKLLIKILLPLILIVSPIITQAADSCTAGGDIRQFFNEIKANPTLAKAIKKNVDLTKVWLDLEDSGETDLNNNPEVLELLFEIPRRVNNDFQKWFDELSFAQAEKLWKNEKLRERIEDRLRKPAGYHEWCMVCRAPTFKKWGITAKEIEKFRTETLLLTWIAPEDSGAEHPGKEGKHGGNGSGAFHNELKKIIDGSNSYSEFQQRVKGLMVRWKIDPSLLTIP